MTRIESIKVRKNRKEKACMHICIHVFKRKEQRMCMFCNGSLKMRMMLKEDF